MGHQETILDVAQQAPGLTLSLGVLAPEPEDDSGGDAVLGAAGEDVPRFGFETFVVLFTTVVCVVGNSLVLIVAARTAAFNNFNRCYLFSLTTADLFLGLFVTPFCIFNTIYGRWIFNSPILCCVEAYLMALFIVVSMMSIAFIIVDHYVAVRKPDRYNVMMSFNRSLCWGVLTWVIATSFCCPPLFSFQKAIYYSETYLCVIDRQNQQTYFLTVTFMVTLPSLAAVLITSHYLFTPDFKDQKQFYQRVYDHFSERSWNYYMSFVITAMFFVTWFPFTFIRVAQAVKGWQKEDIPQGIHFCCMWLGLSNCYSKVIVYLCMSPRFRQGLKEVLELSRASADPNDPGDSGSGESMAEESGHRGGGSIGRGRSGKGGGEGGGRGRGEKVSVGGGGGGFVVCGYSCGYGSDSSESFGSRSRSVSRSRSRSRDSFDPDIITVRPSYRK